MCNAVIRRIVEDHNLRTTEDRKTGKIYGYIPYTTADGFHGEIKEELTGMTLKQLKFWLGY